MPPIRADTVAQKRRRRYQILLGAALGVVLLTAIAVIGPIHQAKHNAAPVHAGTPSRPVTVLDGTYRLVSDGAKRTSNGAPDPGTDNTTWWAFRSLCGSAGCVATAAGLDNTNPKLIRSPAITAALHFADGQWQQMPFPSQVDYPRCLGADGKVVAGAETVAIVRSLEPLPDGTLRGVQTSTVLTNGCGHQGEVLQMPFVAKRTGDGPSGLTMADPAGIVASPPTSTPAPAAAGPALDGAYRIDYDFGHQTVNGAPTTGSTRQTRWWAFRSMCASTRCVAAGASLADGNRQQPSGHEDVLRFIDGHWQDTPYVQPPKPCRSGNGGDISTASLSLQPQTDGTLRGVETTSVLTNECGRQGYLYKTAVVATRIGDVPPAVILADPTLFR
jgi:serine/threonine protein kinase, bacterial